jgi:hypothetical protein
MGMLWFRYYVYSEMLNPTSACLLHTHSQQNFVLLNPFLNPIQSNTINEDFFAIVVPWFVVWCNINMLLDLVLWGVGAWQTGWEGANGDGEQFEAEVGTYKCCIPKTFVCTWYKFQKIAERKVHFPSSWTLCSIQIYIHRLHFKISDFQIHNLGCLNLLQLLFSCLW